MTPAFSVRCRCFAPSACCVLLLGFTASALAQPAGSSVTPRRPRAALSEAAPDQAAEAAAPSVPAVSSEAAILDPTQGHPLILRPGEEFRFLMRLGPGIRGNLSPILRHGRASKVTFPLKAVGTLNVFQERYASATLRLPEKMPTGIYDLVLSSDDQSVLAAHSIKVVSAFKSRFRFVHLSDMTIGDPSAPAFDDRLVEEINLLAPEFIVTTGDYVAWGRALDDPTRWRKVMRFFAKFDAPVYMVCGNQDHEASFTRYVAQSPIGTFDYGRYHGILLLDHAAHPLDADQLEFLRRDLDAHRDTLFNMIVMHNDDLFFLDQLGPRESLAGYLRARKVQMIITGGSDDWDRTEYINQLEGLEDLNYIRTHQSSTCLRGRATGVSHYRVIEVDGENVSYVYPDDTSTLNVEHSIPVGFLRTFFEPERKTRVFVSVQNALNQRFDDARVWIPVAKNGDRQPQVAGGRLVQKLDAGTEWVCEVAVDLPDKGGVRVLAATQGALPNPVPVEVAYAGSHELGFRAERTKTGLSYFKCDQKINLELTNTTERELRTFPVVRLNGNVLPLRTDGGSSWPVTIPPSGNSILSPEFILGRVSPGEHLMQLIFLEDPIRRVVTFPVTLVAQ